LFCANFLTAFAALLSELPSLSTGLTAEPRQVLYLAASSSAFAGFSGKSGIL